jgi:hypothetical protein
MREFQRAEATREARHSQTQNDEMLALSLNFESPESPPAMSTPSFRFAPPVTKSFLRVQSPERPRKQSPQPHVLSPLKSPMKKALKQKYGPDFNPRPLDYEMELFFEMSDLRREIKMLELDNGSALF